LAQANLSLKKPVLSRLSDTMQGKDHRVKLSSGVVDWNVYLIAIAKATQCELAI
jgi:hypothetical protein